MLSPAYYGDNGYRFYGEQELLQLQQILFFRELGFKLDNIKTIINADEFDQLESLKQHKNHLTEKIKSFQSLTKTIDKTMAHLKGEIEMKEHELYVGFKHPKQIEMINYLESAMGKAGKKIIQQAKENTERMNLTPDDVKNLQKETDRWVNSFKKLIVDSVPPTSDKAQALIDEYYQKRIQRFCNPTSDEFIQLIEAESRHPMYKDKFDAIHPDFSKYFLTAAKHYAQTLTKES